MPWDRLAPAVTLIRISGREGMDRIWMLLKNESHNMQCACCRGAALRVQLIYAEHPLLSFLTAQVRVSQQPCNKIICSTVDAISAVNRSQLSTPVREYRTLQRWWAIGLKFREIWIRAIWSLPEHLLTHRSHVPVQLTRESSARH